MPGVAEPETATSRVDVAVPPDGNVTLLGVRVAVIPLVGGPVFSVTVPENVLRLSRVMVDMPEDPMGTLRVAGFADMAKSGTTTLTVTLAVWDIEPLVPVTVTV